MYNTYMKEGMKNNESKIPPNIVKIEFRFEVFECHDILVPK